ncbi:P-loop NTPase fold protein [Rhodococcus sp. 077-4]|uniref:KAP family P-loop NTPase fold protein n=1 Tax=Rhodococcus sp. 077-4 TaxID=2789271 RepID=UPI0039F55D8F
MRQTSKRGNQLIVDGDLIPDNRLASEDADLLDHSAIAQSVAEIAATAATPTNIALFGAWGSGKSSIYSMIAQHLANTAGESVRVVRYDAWKYGGQDLKRNFIHSLAGDLGFGDDPDFSDGLEHEQSRARLHLGKWICSNKTSLAVGLGIAAAVAALWLSVLLLVAVKLGKSTFVDAAGVLIPQAGTVFGLALIAVVVGPQVLQGATVTTKTPAPVGSDQFAKRFVKLVAKVRSKRAERLVVFIDELDRCAPSDVVATLKDLKTFLDEDGCSFIVAADREVIEQSLREVPQAKPVREDEPYYATPGAFLDKIFQHQIALPPLRSRALTRFAYELVNAQGGLWEELRERGDNAFELAVFALIPVHVRSPRRVKVLLNNFATNARIAQARGIGWSDRAHEIATLTVLQTEFPAVADELRRVPRLLSYLRGDEAANTEQIQLVIDRFLLSRRETTQTPRPRERSDADESNPDVSESPAGALLTDDDSAKGVQDLRLADLTLRRHLRMYLSKVHAAGISDPRPDLLYLQAASGRDSLGDPTLGDMIDYATDTAPDTVVAAFREQGSHVLAIAIPLLVTEGDNSYGPGRSFAYESACRLIELIDHSDDSTRNTIATDTSPSLIAASNANTLTTSSLPGALLVAAWAQRSDVTDAILEKVTETEPVDDPLLERLSAALQYVHPDGAIRLTEFLTDDFEDRPNPLMTALRTLPNSSAIKLWTDAAPAVFGTLKRMEEPSTHPTPLSRASDATTAAEEVIVSSPTGDGAARLRSLVDSARQRTDYEELLSAILIPAQSWQSSDSLRSWVLENVDSLISTMSSSTLRAKHALLGLLYSPSHEWVSWATQLQELDQVTTEAISSLAGEVLKDRLLPAILESPLEVRVVLPESVAKVQLLAKLDVGTLVQSLTEIAAAGDWNDVDGDVTTSDIAWSRKKTMVDVSVALVPTVGESVLEPAVEDLKVAVETCALNPIFVDRWISLVRTLPVEAAQSLTAAIDRYQVREAEETAVLTIRVQMRQIHGGAAPPSGELGALPAAEVDTDLTSAWLSLSPDPVEVRGLVGTVPFTAAAFGEYCDTLSVHDRTQIWLVIYKSKVAQQLLTSVGRGGLGHEAVDIVRSSLAELTRAADRAVAVERLTRAEHPADDSTQLRRVRRSCTELATDLISRDTAKDVRTAAELMIWADGAESRQAKAALNKMFTESLDRYKDPLPKSHIKQLEFLQLITPRKGLLGRLLTR